MSLAWHLLVNITTLRSPLPCSRHFELSFRHAECISNVVSNAYARRSTTNNKICSLIFDEMMDPLVAVVGFGLAWVIIGIGHLRGTYGDCAILGRERIAKSHPCEVRT